LKREKLVVQIDEGRCAALAAKFELEQSTVESQSLFNVADLEWLKPAARAFRASAMMLSN
jgi:hypothetical protein